MVLGRVWDAPIIPGAGWKPGSADDPVAFIVVLLAVSVGLPFFALSTTGPLLQAWFARMHPGVSPYRLYAVSNVGSLLALLSYPFIVEPRLSLRVQAQVWSWAYGGFALACAACAAVRWRRSSPAAYSSPWLQSCTCPCRSGHTPSCSSRSVWSATASWCGCGLDPVSSRPSICWLRLVEPSAACSSPWLRRCSSRVSGSTTSRSGGRPCSSSPC